MTSVTAGAAAGALPRRWFLGVEFTAVTVEQAVDLIVERPAEAPFGFVVTPNAQHVVAANRGDARFAQSQRRAWLVLNDSRILSLLSRRLFGERFPTAAGSDVTAALFAGRIRPNDALTIIGGGDEMERRLRTRFGLSRIARLNPPMGFYNDPAEVERCVAFVRDHPARYVFLVVGAPQAEVLAQHILDLGTVTGVGLCVGSALNFVTDVVRRSPRWMRRAGLEWLFRLAQNPVGHAGRVFVASPPILVIALKTWLTAPSRRSHGASL